MSELDQLQAELSTEEQLIAGLIPTPGHPVDEKALHENLLQLQERIDVEHLAYVHRLILQTLTSFREDIRGSGVISNDIFLDILRRQNLSPEDQVGCFEKYQRLALHEISAGKFKYLLTRFNKERLELGFVKALEDSFTVYKLGKRVGRKTIQGYAAARQFLEDSLFRLDQDTGNQTNPEGDVRESSMEVVQEYQERKDKPEAFEGVKTGIDVVDKLTNGAQPGELWIIGGYTEVGKTFNMINSAHYACTVQKKNVVMVTTEVAYNQYRRRIALRHARSAEYGLPHGIDSGSYKNAALTPDEEVSFVKAMEGFRDNPNYGRMFVIQLPKGAGLSWIANKLNFLNAMWPVHALYIDSLNQLPNPNGMDNQRQFFNQTVREAKQFALGFDKGRAIPIFSPWHANRKSWEEALKNGKYNLASWQECDELERSADLLMWMLKLETEQETREIQAGIVKYRDGSKHSQFTLYHDFASSYIGSVAPLQVGQSSGNQAQTNHPAAPQGPSDKASDLF